MFGVTTVRSWQMSSWVTSVTMAVWRLWQQIFSHMTDTLNITRYENCCLRRLLVCVTQGDQNKYYWMWQLLFGLALSSHDKWHYTDSRGTLIRTQARPNVTNQVTLLDMRQWQILLDRSDKSYQWHMQLVITTTRVVTIFVNVRHFGMFYWMQHADKREKKKY